MAASTQGTGKSHRGPGRKFQKGQSGNPAGRKVEVATADVRDLARQHTTAAVDRLAHWLESDNARASVAAAEALLDRGWGRPPQHVNLDPSSALAAALELMRAKRGA